MLTAARRGIRSRSSVPSSAAFATTLPAVLNTSTARIVSCGSLRHKDSDCLSLALGASLLRKCFRSASQMRDGAGGVYCRPKQCIPTTQHGMPLEYNRQKDPGWIPRVSKPVRRLSKHSAADDSLEFSAERTVVFQSGSGSCFCLRMTGQFPSKQRLDKGLQRQSTAHYSVFSLPIFTIQ